MFGRESPSPAIASALVILLGLSVAVFTFNLTRGVEAQQWEDQFGESGSRYAQRLADGITQQTDLLRFLSTLFTLEASGRTGMRLSSEDLRAFVDPVFARAQDSRYGPLRTVAWVQRVEAGDLSSFVRIRRVEGDDARFTVHDRMLDAVEQDSVHDVVDHACSRYSYEQVEGLALSSDPKLAAVLEEAATSGAAAMSGPTRPLSDEADPLKLDVLVALPVYQGGATQRPPAVTDRVKGFVIGMFSLQDLLQQALRQPDHLDPSPEVHLALYDEKGELLAEEGRPAMAGFAPSRHDLEVFDRLWTVLVSPVSRPAPSVDEFLAKPSTLLTASICIMVLLFAWITWTMSRRSEVIQQRVAAQTAESRQKTLELERKERELNDANRRLLEMSNTDPLTSILNRRAFEVQVDKERERAQRTGVPFGLLIFDVDSFKDYNDRYGHAAGDEVLRRVAGIINAEARRIDTVARYGGEEFVVLATGTDAVGLLALGERIRGRVQDAAIVHASMPKGVITVSGGGSLSNAAVGHDAKLAFEVADRCLYQAKSTGRNRVVMVM